MTYYHGSKTKIEGYLKPMPSRVIDNEKAVFATPSKTLALIYSCKWNDSDIELGRVNGKLVIREQYPNAFDLLKNDGYIYEFSSDGFQTDKRLGMKNDEFINYNKVKILKTYKVSNVLTQIKKLKEVTLITIDEYVKFLDKCIRKKSK